MTVNETDALAYLDGITLIEGAVRVEAGESVAPIPAFISEALVQAIARMAAIHIAEREDDPLAYVQSLRRVIQDGIRTNLV